MVRESLKVAQSRQKSYVDKRRDLSFDIGHFVYLKVSPMRGTHRFRVKGKLALRYVGPFKIIDRKGEVAYQLDHYKRGSTPPSSTTPPDTHLPLSPRLSIALTKRCNCRFFTTIARSPRRSSVLGQAPNQTLASSSSFQCSRVEPSWTRAPVGRAPMSSSGRRWRPVHDGLEPRWSTTHGPSSRNSQFKNKSEIQLFRHFALSPLIFSNINPQSLILQLGPVI
jgi:hypothetical protein